jgi:hypothetical protein
VLSPFFPPCVPPLCLSFLQVVAGTLPLPHVLEGDATAQPCSRLTAALYNLAETIAWYDH